MMSYFLFAETKSFSKCVFYPQNHYASCFKLNEIIIYFPRESQQKKSFLD